MLQVLGWVFLPIYLACGAYTIPEYLNMRFGGRRIRVYLSVLSLLIYILNKISVNLFSGYIFISHALQWDFASSLALLLSMSAFCTVGGGLTAVIYTDTVQAFLMCTGGVVLSIFSFVKVGGFTGLYSQYLDAAPVNVTANSTCGFPPSDGLQILREPSDPTMPWPGFIFGLSASSIWYWCTDQLIVQRALAAKNLSHAKGGVLLAGYLKMSLIFIMIMPGMISRVLFPNEIGCATAEECLKICGSESGCTNLAYPMLITRLLPQGFRGLMAAVMLAALVSDLTSIYNSSSSLFTMDIYPSIRKAASNREQMIVGRLFTIVMTIASVIWIPIIESNQGGQLIMYIHSVTACFCPPVAAVFVIAILWPRANETASELFLQTNL